MAALSAFGPIVMLNLDYLKLTRLGIVFRKAS